MAERIHAEVGEVFEIPLEATPTAGFRWELSSSTERTDLVDFVGTEWRQLVPGLVGGSATQIFRFNAVAPGELILVFEYRRPWEAFERKREDIEVLIAPRNAGPGDHDARRPGGRRTSDPTALSAL